MAVKIYEYAKCATCRKALKFLEARGVVYEKVSIVETPPSRAELEAVLRRLGGDWGRLFNKSGELYREMGLSAKLTRMSEGEALSLLARHGKLVKRPFVPSLGLVGFDESEWARALRRA